jgi:hypothetical protein
MRAWQFSFSFAYISNNSRKCRNGAQMNEYFITAKQKRSDKAGRHYSVDPQNTAITASVSV